MTRPDSLLAHPALAGRTLLVRRGGQWAAHLIDSQGSLGQPESVASNPADQIWRTGHAA